MCGCATRTMPHGNPTCCSAGVGGRVGAATTRMSRGGGKGDQSRRLVVPASSARQCRHCRVVFSADENHRGSCDSAPDAATDCIECVTCVSCTKPLFYHCCADADGQYSHPCQCSGGRGGGVGGGGGVRGGGGGGGGEEERNCRKWIGLTLLSCLLPCLWCYLPLHACHRCGVACGPRRCLCGVEVTAYVCPPQVLSVAGGPQTSQACRLGNQRPVNVRNKRQIM
ncbi:hypothetical protein ACOMHN_061016 [Nucella lapillus]